MAIPLDTHSRTDDIVDAISRLVLEGGVERVTMRAIADQVRISQGTLANHLSNRERLLRVCAFRFADRRMRELDDQVRRVGAVGLMPLDDHDRRSARVWLAWREAARHAPGPARAVAEADVREAVGAHEEHALDVAAARELWLAQLGAAASARARSSATIASGSSAE